MLIIIEGADGTGKTTLARRLAEALPTRRTNVRHCGPLRRPPLDEYEFDLADYEPGQNRHVIYDRHYMGELVYGPLYRDESKLTPAMLLHVEMLLNAKGAVLVHLTHDIATLRRRNQESGESFLKDEDLEFVVRKYKQLFATTRIHHAVTVVDPNGIDVDEVLKLGEVAESETAPLAQFSTYIGSPRPAVLLLGERLGPAAPEFPWAFVPLSNTSGGYLFATLIGVSHEVGSWGVANAFDEDVPSLVQAVQVKSIVTLGSSSHVLLRQLGIAHSAVPHPQFVRRFHHGRMQEYRDLIDFAARGGALDLSRWPESVR